MTPAAIVQNLWNYCSVLRDDGMSYGDYTELVTRDKENLDIIWIRDESLEDSDNLPEPGVIARDMVADLESALEQLRLIAEDLGDDAVILDNGVVY